MKLSDVINRLIVLQERMGNDDPEVMIASINPGVPTRLKSGISYIGQGGDWEKNLIIIGPTKTMAIIETVADIAAKASDTFDVINQAYAKAGFKFYPQRHKDAWVDGYKKASSDYVIELGVQNK